MIISLTNNNSSSESSLDVTIIHDQRKTTQSFKLRSEIYNYVKKKIRYKIKLTTA